MGPSSSQAKRKSGPDLRTRLTVLRCLQVLESRADDEILGRFHLYGNRKLDFREAETDGPAPQS
jgi:hypothetical protein